jgi:hypothetical protein
VTEVLSQLNPIMEQLAGVNLRTFLQDISRLPGAVASKLEEAAEAAAESQGQEAKE